MLTADRYLRKQTLTAGTEAKIHFLRRLGVRRENCAST